MTGTQQNMCIFSYFTNQANCPFIVIFCLFIDILDYKPLEDSDDEKVAPKTTLKQKKLELLEKAKFQHIVPKIKVGSLIIKF